MVDKSNSSQRFTVGCAGWPPGLYRDRYFDKLDILEIRETFAAPPTAKTLCQWRAIANSQYGIVADRRITHSAKESHSPQGSSAELAAQWGGFRDTTEIRQALAQTAQHAAQVHAQTVLFHSPAGFSPSTSNRYQLQKFFAEVVGDTLANTILVWEPGGLWDTRTAIKLANEIGLVVAVDAFAADPQGNKHTRPIEWVPRQLGYLRQQSLGRHNGYRAHELEELAHIVSQFERCFAIFTHKEKNRDGKALRRSSLPANLGLAAPTANALKTALKAGTGPIVSFIMTPL